MAEGLRLKGTDAHLIAVRHLGHKVRGSLTDNVARMLEEHRDDFESLEENSYHVRESLEELIENVESDVTERLLFVGNPDSNSSDEDVARALDIVADVLQDELDTRLSGLDFDAIESVNVELANKLIDVLSHARALDVEKFLDYSKERKASKISELHESTSLSTWDKELNPDGGRGWSRHKHDLIESDAALASLQESVQVYIDTQGDGTYRDPYDIQKEHVEVWVTNTVADIRAVVADMCEPDTLSYAEHALANIENNLISAYLDKGKTNADALEDLIDSLIDEAGGDEFKRA